MKYSLDDTPAMSLKRDMLYDRAQKSDFLKFNEKREMTGHEKIDEGDVILVPMSSMPLSQAGEDFSDGFNDIEEETSKNLINNGFSNDDINEIMNGENL